MLMDQKHETHVFGTKLELKIRYLSIVFSLLFPSAFLNGFLVDVWRLEILEIELSPRREHNFYKIDVFYKSGKNIRYWLHFQRKMRGKFDSKSI